MHILYVMNIVSPLYRSILHFTSLHTCLHEGLSWALPSEVKLERVLCYWGNSLVHDRLVSCQRIFFGFRQVSSLPLMLLDGLEKATVKRAGSSVEVSILIRFE